MSAKSLSKNINSHKYHNSVQNPFNEFYIQYSPSNFSKQILENDKRDRKWDHPKKQNKPQRFSAFENYQKPISPNLNVERRMQETLMHQNVRSSFDSNMCSSKLSVKKIKMNMFINETKTTSIMDLKQTLQSQTSNEPNYREVIKKLSEQISEQQKNIHKLHSILQTLVLRLGEKEKEIHNLQGLLKNRGSGNNPEQSIYEKKFSVLHKKIADHETKNSRIIEMLENGNEKVNNKMDEVSRRIVRVLGGRYNNLKGLFLNYLKTKQKSQEQEKKAINEYKNKIERVLKDIKGKLNSSNSLIFEDSVRTGAFNDVEQDDDLSSTNSYFFHPCDIKHLSKIEELFSKHKFEPLRCYLDEKNRLKYKDSNTFVFDRRGDTICLSEKQKRYYIDKGLMIYQ